MLGLGASISKNKKLKKPIVKDNLVLKHNYMRGGVHQVSTGAAFFDGSSDYIQLPSKFNHKKITVSAWIYVTTGGTTSVIYESRDSTNQGFLFYVDSNNKARIKAMGNVDLTGTAGLPVNNWVHACFTYDDSNPSSEGLKLYENGFLMGAASEGDDVSLTDSNNARIGGGVLTASGYYFDGYICNVGIWDEVLTQAQVKSIMWKNYADLTSSETADLVSWYNLDEETNTSGGAGTGGVKDHHGSNHGTLA